MRCKSGCLNICALSTTDRALFFAADREWLALGTGLPVNSLKMARNGLIMGEKKGPAMWQDPGA